MQLHNAAGPPPILPTSYYYSTHIETWLAWAQRRVCGTRLFDRVDFSSSIALASITAKQTRFNAGLSGCFMDGLIYGSARITDLWIYESRMRPRCDYRSIFNFNTNALLHHRCGREKQRCIFHVLVFCVHYVPNCAYVYDVAWEGLIYSVNVYDVLQLDGWLNWERNITTSFLYSVTRLEIIHLTFYEIPLYIIHAIHIIYDTSMPSMVSILYFILCSVFTCTS